MFRFSGRRSAGVIGQQMPVSRNTRCVGCSRARLWQTAQLDEPAAPRKAGLWYPSLSRLELGKGNQITRQARYDAYSFLSEYGYTILSTAPQHTAAV